MYKTTNIILRIIAIVATCMLIFFASIYITDIEIPLWNEFLKTGIVASVIFVIGSEGILFIDNYFNKNYPIKLRKTKHRFYKAVAIFLFQLIVISLALPYFVHNHFNHQKTFLLGVIFSIIYIVMFDTILIIRNIYRNWKQDEQLYNQLKQEKLKSDYKALQNQLNPHFLFNSLNVLISEIRYNKDSAIKYAEELADIYRYVLQSKDNYTVSLKQELDFLNSYIYIYQIKYGQNLKFKINIPEEVIEYEMPPMVLQILVENALKHNSITPSKPLEIEIFYDDDKVCVKNNVSPKSATFSTQTGLSNVKKRYELLSEQKVEIKNNNETFLVKAPLFKD